MATTCKYAVHDAVEVFRHDFEIPGFPETWQRGIVVDVTAANEDRGLWSVHVQLGPASWSPQLVGPRGGNKRIRPAAPAPTTHRGPVTVRFHDGRVMVLCPLGHLVTGSRTDSRSTFAGSALADQITAHQSGAAPWIVTCEGAATPRSTR